MSCPRRVHYSAGYKFSPGEFHVNYMDYRTGALIPGTEVWIGERLRLRINALGCKGEELDPNLETIGVFGDSCAFGRAMDSWPSQVVVPGYQVLNGGVEGYSLDRCAEKYESLRSRVAFDAVVLGGSWHNLVYNAAGESAWSERFDRFLSAPVFALCTLPTALSDVSCERGLEGLLERQRFIGFGEWPTCREKTRELFDAVLRYNDHVHRYCEDTGALLIDLFSVYRPPSYEATPEMFHDPCHPRVTLYPALAMCVSDVLKAHLCVEREVSVCLSNAVVAERVNASEHEEQGAQVYPLW